MPKLTVTSTGVVTFLRKRDYHFVKELGKGACGQTVLLHDDVINEHFVCKKYLPYDEQRRSELFQLFLREIKLLHQLYHDNIVRVFNYYVYPDCAAGYILMEYVNGLELHDYLVGNPEQLNDIFVQVVSGLSYLQTKGILHRDIRPANIGPSDFSVGHFSVNEYAKERIHERHRPLSACARLGRTVVRRTRAVERGSSAG